MAQAIVGIGIMFFLGHALSWMFAKTKVPDLLVLVVLGYLLGPIFGVLNGADFGKVGGVISALALIVILYEGGLSLSAKDLLTSSLPAAALSLLSFSMSIVIGIIVAYGFAMKSMPAALLLGVGIGSTSSAIVMPMVKFLSIDLRTKTILALESAFTDVLTIVIFLVLVDSIAAGSFDAKDLAVGLGPNTIIAGLIGFSSALVWALFKRKFANIMPKAFAGEAWALLTYGLLEISGYNGAIGVLALGFTLANLNLLPNWLTQLISNKPVSVKELSLLAEITFLLRTFFFLYLGLLIKFTSVKIVLLALLACILIFASRYLVVQWVFKKSLTSRLDAMVASAMGPRGLACAVLATIPLQRGIADGDFIQNIMFSIIPLSIFFTALFVALAESSTMRAKLSRFFLNYQELEPGTTHSKMTSSGTPASTGSSLTTSTPDPHIKGD